MTKVVWEFTAHTDNPGPPKLRQKAAGQKKVNLTVGSRRENFPHETLVEFKNICTRQKKSLVWTFPRRDPTGKLTFFYPAASCRNSGGPGLSVRCCKFPKHFGHTHPPKLFEYLNTQ